MMIYRKDARDTILSRELYLPGTLHALAMEHRILWLFRTLIDPQESHVRI
jgi:hypothetical protein